MASRPARAPLNVYLNARLVGRLRRESSGAIDFQYDKDWLAWESAIPVSVSLPLREDRYIGDPVIAVFVSTQPSLDTKQIGQNQMKLAMAVGDNRHYVVHTITGRHFVQTAKSCGLPDKTVKDVVTALSDTGAKTIDQVLGALPKGFPEKIAASIAEGTMRRLKSLALNGGKD